MKIINRGNQSEDILATALDRGRAKRLAYAGEVTPREAHRLYTTHGARIIDVRSRAEHQLIGRIPGSRLIEWKFWPGGEINVQFLPELRRQFSTGDMLLFLCRSGVRSHLAATVAAEAGYHRSMNILEGFEGDLDDDLRRGQCGGWRRAGLPWVQS